MAQTLLAVCQQASREMGIGAPATIIGNADLYAVQLLNLYNGLGQDLSREYDWQRLQREHSFSTEFYQYTGDTTTGSTTLSNMSSIASLDATFMAEGTGIPTDSFVVSAAATDVVINREATSTGATRTFTFSKVQYSLPSGFDRPTDRTQWDKTESIPMFGPKSAQEWQWIKGGDLASAGRDVWFRLFGNYFQIFPPLGAERFMRFEYCSAFWAGTSASATPTLSTVTADTDVAIFSDRLMVEGLKLRFRIDRGTAMNRHPMEDIRAGYPMRLLDIAKANDAGSPDLSMKPKHGAGLLSPSNFPEGDYGS